MSKDKREEILKAAEKVLRTKRFHEVKMDDVAKEAGVGKGTIYRYFKDKEDLYIAVALEGFINIQVQLKAIVDRDMDYIDKIIEISNCLAKLSKGRKPVLRVMEEALERKDQLAKCYAERTSELKRKVRQTIAQVFQHGLDNNLLKLDVTADQYAELWIHQIIGLSRFPSEVEKIPIDAIIQLHLRGSNEGN